MRNLLCFSRLKTVSLVVKHSQSAEALVKTYESKLYEEDAMNPDIKSIESATSALKVRKSSSSVFEIIRRVWALSHSSSGLMSAMADGDR